MSTATGSALSWPSWRGGRCREGDRRRGASPPYHASLDIGQDLADILFCHPTDRTGLNGRLRSGMQVMWMSRHLGVVRRVVEAVYFRGCPFPVVRVAAAGVEPNVQKGLIRQYRSNRSSGPRAHTRCAAEGIVPWASRTGLLEPAGIGPQALATILDPLPFNQVLPTRVLRDCVGVDARFQFTR